MRVTKRVNEILRRLYEDEGLTGLKEYINDPRYFRSELYKDLEGKTLLDKTVNLISDWSNPFIKEGIPKGTINMIAGEELRAEPVGVKGWKTSRTNKSVMKKHKAFEEFVIGSGNNKRTITLCVVNRGNGVSVGYSVCRPEDEFKRSIARNISEGRANSENNLDGYGLDQRLVESYYMLKSILLMWKHKIKKNPSKYIKGLKGVTGGSERDAFLKSLVSTDK